MKLVLAIIQDKDSNRLSQKFVEANIQATKLSTTGGFLRSGNTTVLIGVEDERVDEVLDIIKDVCKAREQYVTAPLSMDATFDSSMAYPIEVQVGGATVFVLPVDSFHRY